MAEVNVIGKPQTGNPPTGDPLAGNLTSTATANQSSTFFGGLPARAIDWNTDGRWSQNSVTHTLFEAQPWWEATLQNNADIDRIVLFNRTDWCCTGQLKDVHVFVSDTPFSQDATLESLLTQEGVWRIYLEGVQGEKVEIPVNTLGRYVRVQLAGSGVLSLAEVEVIGLTEQ